MTRHIYSTRMLVTDISFVCVCRYISSTLASPVNGAPVDDPNSWEISEEISFKQLSQQVPQKSPPSSETKEPALQ